jgi:hypothetical protein
LIAIPIASAAPAQAAAFSVTIANCTVSALSFSPSSTVGAGIGDTVVVTNNFGGPTLNTTLTGATGPASLAFGGNATFTPTSSSGTIAFANGSCSGTITFGGGGGGASAGSGAPAPVVQEFGLPASGTCAAAASKDLNWAGVPSGGWSVSWGQWMNGGRGGAVCTRTLTYSTLTSAWGVAS